MRCTHCDYPLWNIRARLCPECGTHFKPSDFEFTPNAVRFLCPHCNQDYYGTDAHGHLVPPEFDCVRCAHHVRMDDMLLLPTEGVDERRTEPDPMPWRHRARVGRVKAFAKTVFASMFTPPLLMRADPGPSPAGAWGFLLLSTLLYFAPTLLLVLGLALSTAFPVGFAIMTILVGIYALVPLWALIWTFAAHLLLRLTGPTAHGLTGTTQAICYASGPNVFLLVPCLVTYTAPLAGVWWIVSATLMLAERQQVRGWRASLAGIVPGVIVFVALVAGFFGLMSWGMYNATSAASPAQTRTETALVAQAIVAHATETGANPDHALQLVADGRLQTWDLVLSSTQTMPMNVPVGLQTLENFGNASSDARADMLATVTEALPDDAAAHRFGDFVFTYHDIDPTSPDPALWIVIASPDPDVRHWGGPGPTLSVGRADGTATLVGRTNFPELLAAQNRLRTRLGLPTIPDPTTVTHANPATTEDQ